MVFLARKGTIATDNAEQLEIKNELYQYSRVGHCAWAKHKKWKLRM